jgi:hypothetical protein
MLTNIQRAKLIVDSIRLRQGRMRLAHSMATPLFGSTGMGNPPLKCDMCMFRDCSDGCETRPEECWVANGLFVPQYERTYELDGTTG